MSTFSRADRACPTCARSVRCRVARALSVTRSPKQRQAILDETFQRFECPACDGAFVIEDAFQYTDLAHRHLIFVAPRGDEPRWRELESIPRGVYERTFVAKDASPHARPLADGFRVRTVFGLHRLREKLLVWDSGRDDVALELVKIDLQRRRREDITRAGEWLLIDTSAGFRLRREQLEVTVPLDAPIWAAVESKSFAGLKAALSEGTFVDAARLLR